MTTVLFWIGVILLAAPDGSKLAISSNPKPSRETCVEAIKTDGLSHVEHNLAPLGYEATAAYCVPVTGDSREPLVGGPAT